MNVKRKSTHNMVRSTFMLCSDQELPLSRIENGAVTLASEVEASGSLPTIKNESHRETLQELVQAGNLDETNRDKMMRTHDQTRGSSQEDLPRFTITKNNLGGFHSIAGSLV